MKKSLIFIYIFLVIFLVSFVSAFSFSDFFNKITGQATLTCTDSDGGKNYEIFGTAKDSFGISSDKCLADGRTLREYYCSGSFKTAVDYICPSICGNNVCAKWINGTGKKCSDGTSVNQCSIEKPKYCFLGSDLSSEPILINDCSICGCPYNDFCSGEGKCEELNYCADSDNGKNYFIKGLCTDSEGLHEDSCNNSGKIEEWYCSELENKCILEESVCDNVLSSDFVCQGGECVSSEKCEDTCSSLGYECENWNICGEKINCGNCSLGKECIEGRCEVPSNCKNECDFEGQRVCENDDSYRLCGNYDEDICLEFGELAKCSFDKRCFSGMCGERTLKALAVIVDFQDKKLEDYTGEGINSISDLRSILNKMESHWEWMSTGVEKISWDIIRVTVPHDLTGEVDYPYYNGSNWFYFQDVIIKNARKKVDIEKYDNNGDGEMDNVFAIISSGEKDASNSVYHYIVGGAANTIYGTKIFMDPQGSESVKREAYGNFNHELGHGHAVKDDFWGLPDIYGEYDTLGYLSLMSDSWPLPANDFSAYDKYLLEWISPLKIFSTKKDTLLLPAEENLEAVKILTDNPKEFFLIEYRKKPEEGYGSSDWHGNYNGLAIYHVNEEALGTYADTDFPPLIYLEPADGENVFPSAPLEEDFWFPENEKSTGIFEAKKWDSDEVLFKVENLRWSGEGIMFDIVFEEDLNITEKKIDNQKEKSSSKLSNCDGCQLEGKCYLFGYRKSGEFCSDDGIFVKQFDERKSCENNFECKSNVCVNDECVSESLISKIMSWFRKLFGRE